MHCYNLGAAVYIGERDRNRHLAPHRGTSPSNSINSTTCSFGTSLMKRPWYTIRVRARLPCSSRRVVSKRKFETCHPRGGRTHARGWSGRRNLPLCDCVRVNKRAVDLRAWRYDVAMDAFRVHARTLAAGRTGRRGDRVLTISTATRVAQCYLAIEQATFGFAGLTSTVRALG